MVTFAAVGKRHALYGIAVVAIVSLAEFTWTLAALLLVVLGVVKQHMGTPSTFALLACVCGPACAALCARLSVHTLWFAHGVPWLVVPAWLPPAYGLLAHWAIDLYFLTTVRDLRRQTLP